MDVNPFERPSSLGNGYVRGDSWGEVGCEDPEDLDPRRVLRMKGQVYPEELVIEDPGGVLGFTLLLVEGNEGNE